MNKFFSVIGLNFDFLALNIVGFTLYGCYNVALFWIHSVQAEYKSRHPMGVIPVQANDVFFPIHAVWACAITIIQCFIYEVSISVYIINIKKIHLFRELVRQCQDYVWVFWVP